MRSSGVLMHLTSLSSPYGIGTMGKAAYEFVDFLEKAGQSYWQILPVCPTSYGDSPYQSFSTFAGNPYLIDLDLLMKDGLLKKEEYDTIDWEADDDRVNFGAMYVKRYPVLKKAVDRFLLAPSQEYDAFVSADTSFWLEDYALFMALKDAHKGASWSTWDEELKLRKPEALEKARAAYKKEISFWKVLQFFFIRQWMNLKDYANQHNIRIIGDLPIYVAADSVDVWSAPKQFQLDKNLDPIDVAGCPPDAFSADGQLWGNPLFDWDAMKKDGYSWWLRRISHVSRIYDVIRIDHFRGFAGYYAIPFGDKTARNGEWRTGPGMDLFDVVSSKLGRLNIIAEDLGFLTEDVIKMLKASGYPGMKVLEFAFDSREGGEYKPHSYYPNCIAYTGTHDNESVDGWMETADRQDVEIACEYLNLTKEEGYNWGMMRGIWSSAADLAVVQAQDILGLGHEARMNTPSTTGCNWMWRALPGVFDDKLADKLYQKMELFGRAPAKKAAASDAAEAEEQAAAKKTAVKTDKTEKADKIKNTDKTDKTAETEKKAVTV